jgi:GNAT superfamily N-acetyltransferase
MEALAVDKPALEQAYLPNVEEFLHSLGTKNLGLSAATGNFSFWQADIEIRGPWNVLEFDRGATVDDARRAIAAVRTAHRVGEIRPFVVRLTPRDDRKIAEYLEKEGHDWPFDLLRPLRCETILCRDEDSECPRRCRDVEVVRIRPKKTQFKAFASAQLEGYGFGEPSPRDAAILGSMYEQWDQKEGRLWFFVARRSKDIVGTLTVLPLQTDSVKVIGVYGIAVSPKVRHQGVGRLLALSAIEEVRRIPAFATNRPRPPTLVALCDLDQYNERLFFTLGFRRAEVRPIYGGVANWMLEERKSLRRFRWRMPP